MVAGDVRRREDRDYRYDSSTGGSVRVSVFMYPTVQLQLPDRTLVGQSDSLSFTWMTTRMLGRDQLPIQEPPLPVDVDPSTALAPTVRGRPPSYEQEAQEQPIYLCCCQANRWFMPARRQRIPTPIPSCCRQRQRRRRKYQRNGRISCCRFATAANDASRQGPSLTGALVADLLIGALYSRSCAPVLEVMFAESLR